VGYPLTWVYREVAFLACRVHWTYGEVMGLEHAERRRWVDELVAMETPVGN